MIVNAEFVDLPAASTPMRVMLARPAAEGTYPGLLLYSDIFALTASMQRAIVRFASHGFVVAAPEIYHRVEPAGRALDFTADYETAQDSARKLHTSEIDEDVRVVLDELARHPAVGGKSLHATGFCIGGHLAFRAALQPEVRSAVCFYPTGLHTRTLGGDTTVDTLARCGDVRGDLLVVFGAHDPHVPLAGRRAIDDTLRAAGVRYLISEYDGEHAFMRDEGPRYNAAETDRAMAQAVAFLHQHA
ncbi:MAG: dienelactone hydrolase family protein [Candidatus Elarobacter sp.]